MGYLNLDKQQTEIQPFCSKTDLDDRPENYFEMEYNLMEK